MQQNKSGNLVELLKPVNLRRFYLMVSMTIVLANLPKPSHMWHVVTGKMFNQTFYGSFISLGTFTYFIQWSEVKSNTFVFLRKKIQPLLLICFLSDRMAKALLKCDKVSPNPSEKCFHYIFHFVSIFHFALTFSILLLLSSDVGITIIKVFSLPFYFDYHFHSFFYNY